MSLRNRIFFASSGVFLVGFLTLILAVTFMTQATSQKSGEDLIRKTAEALALDAGKTLAQAQLAARAAADALEGMQHAGVSDRNAYAAVMQHQISQNKHFVGGGAILEPDMAGKDADNAGANFSDEKGRFIPYFYHAETKSPGNRSCSVAIAALKSGTTSRRTWATTQSPSPISTRSIMSTC